MLQFILDHQAVIAGAAVGFLDLLFAIKPSWQSNGALHWIFVALSKKQGSDSVPK